MPDDFSIKKEKAMITTFIQDRFRPATSFEFRNETIFFDKINLIFVLI